MEGQSFKVDRRGCRPGAQFRVVFRQMLFTINSRTKWKVVAAEYRKETLEKLRVGLRDHCEKSLQEISRDMPSLCVTLAGGSDYPITHHELNTTLALSTEQFTSRQKQAFDSVRSTLPSWLKLLN